LPDWQELSAVYQFYHEKPSAVKPEKVVCACQQHRELPHEERIRLQAEVIRRLADIAPDHALGAVLLGAAADLQDYASLVDPRSQVLMLKPWPEGQTA
jgi:hypothetical protein